MSERTYTVRPARPEEASEVLELIRQLATYCQAADFFKLTLSKIWGVLRNQSQSTSGPWYYVAEEDGRLIGFIYFGTMPCFRWSGVRPVYVEDLFVIEERRHGSGVGSALLAAAAQVALSIAEEDGDASSAQLALDTDRLNNDDTIRAYNALKADDSHLNMRFSGQQLRTLIRRAITNP